MILPRRMIRPATLFAMVLACVSERVGLCAEPPAVPAQTSPPTLEQVIDGLQHREMLFFECESLLLRYERTDTEDVLPSTASGGYLPAEWTLASRGDKWYLEQRFTRPAATEAFTIPAEPKIGILKDNLLMEWRQSAQTVFLDPFGMGGNVYAGLYYTDHLALDVPKRIAESGGADIVQVRQQHRGYTDHCFLPAFLRRNKSEYRVLPKPDDVDGFACWVVEWPEMDRFWVDPRHGFAIRRRSYHWAPGKPLRLEVLNRDYREVKPGLWLPHLQEVNTYASITAEKKSLWGRMTCRSMYRLHEVEFDTVGDELFDVRLPDGTRVVDGVRGIKYTVATSEGDPFEREIKEVWELIEEKPPVNTRMLWLINTAVACVLAAYILLRRSRGSA